MTTTDKRAAAIAALGGPEKARCMIERVCKGDRFRDAGRASNAVRDLALAALEADDGRALLAKDSEIDELKTEDGNLRARLADATADIERMRGHVGSLRAKLAEAEASASNALSLMRAKEAECAMATNRAEKAEGEAKVQRAEWTAVQAENSKLRAERDTALAAQNARAVEVTQAILDELAGVEGEPASYNVVRRAKVALRAAKPEPAAEPVPAAADAKPGDEVLRKVWDALRNTPHAAVSLEQQKWCIAVERVVCELVERALEVRP